MLPQALIQSLQGVPGFDANRFQAVHQSGLQVTSVRTNPHKPATSTGWEQLVQNAVPWCPYGHYLTQRPSFTLDPVFHAGAYYVQEASSMFLWHALQQAVGNAEGKKVLDLCAAPGGKSTLLASYCKDGLVVSNEVIKSRAGILVENITKWGSDHVVVTNNDPADFRKVAGFFDVLVVDAPCSGSGLFRKDPHAIEEWSINNVALCSQRQQRILADAWPCLKEDGILIYSTCSYSKAENEEVLDWMAEQLGVASVPLQVPAEWHITTTVSDKHGLTGYRFYPNQVAGEGFFIAVLRKQTPAEYGTGKELALHKPDKNKLALLQQWLPLPQYYSVFAHGEQLKTVQSRWLQDVQVLSGSLYIRKAGITLGEVKGKDLVPHHELAMSTLPLNNIALVVLDKDQALQYLRKKDVALDAAKGWNLVQYAGLPLGWIKAMPNRFNNYYPQDWRILKD
jgi:16S rRNA C967 or C1407 C5-methylase (RsmB/RsmF family)/NOL1/NOP2/fmu family ribosome biogenesis protein